MEVRLRVAGPLRLFLPARGRPTGELVVRHDPDVTLGHVVEAAGVPLPEVGALLVAGEPVAPAHRPAPGDVVDVHPPSRPQPLGGPPRLLLDVHLGALARRLRLLGIDTLYDRDADDPELVVVAAAQDRLLLTQDRGLLKRRALRRGAYVRGSRPDEQVEDVLDRFALPLAPYTRCTACNGLLAPVDAAQVQDRLEPGTRRTQSDFARCQHCDRISWHGAHARRLDALVARACAPRT